MKYQQTKPHTILVFGATGNQGGTVARHFLQAGFGVKAVTRHLESDDAREIARSGAKLVQADLYDRTSLSNAMKDVYGIYLVLPFFQENQEREVEMGRNVIDAARDSNINHLIYSSGSRANERTNVPHLDSKGEIERYLRSSSVPNTVLRPVAFNYSLQAYRESVLQGILPDPRAGDSVVYQVSEHDHATFALMAFLDPNNWLGRGFETASDALTVTEMAQVFSEVVGKPVEHKQISWEEEEKMAGKEVVRLSKWVENDGPRIDIDARKLRYPWLTSLKDYLLKHGWSNAAK